VHCPEDRALEAHVPEDGGCKLLAKYEVLKETRIIVGCDCIV
jgi:hypothetical protein